ncbi:MAG: type IX secretion system plug protein domain-containing protein, partial [Schleiferiaceae bacterium]
MWHPVDRVDAPPVVGLGQASALQLRFDDFSQSVLPLRYVWVHCDRNWQPSSIIASEYLSGFWEGQIAEGRLSFNTYQGYSHY